MTDYSELVLQQNLAKELQSLSTSDRSQFDSLFRKRIGNSPLNQIPVVKVPDSDQILATPNIIRLYKIQKKHPNSSFLSNPFQVILKGVWDSNLVEAAINKFVEINPMLNASFEEVSDDIFIKFGVSQKVPFTFLGDSVSAENIDYAKENFISKSFNLNQDSLVRALFFTNATTNESIVLMNIHHIVSDGWSGMIFQRQFEDICNTLHQDENYAAADIEHDFRDYCYWLNSWVGGNSYHKAKEYWLKQLNNEAIGSFIHSDVKFNKRVSYQCKNRIKSVDSTLFESIKLAGEKLNVSLFAYCLTAYAIFYKEAFPYNPVCIGTPIAGRPRDELSNQYGYFVNKLALYFDLDEHAGFKDALETVKSGFAGAFEHQDFPFHDLVAELNPDRIDEPNPIYDTVFTLSDLVDKPSVGESGVHAIQVKDIRALDLTEGEFDLLVSIYPKPEGWQLNFLYSVEQFDENDIDGLMDRYIAILTESLSE